VMHSTVYPVGYLKGEFTYSEHACGEPAALKASHD
jgi:hypothetical protein